MFCQHGVVFILLEHMRYDVEYIIKDGQFCFGHYQPEKITRKSNMTDAHFQNAKKKKAEHIEAKKRCNTVSGCETHFLHWFFGFPNKQPLKALSFSHSL